MLSSYINVYGLLEERAFRFDKLTTDLVDYNYYFFFLLITLTLFYLIIQMVEVNKIKEVKYLHRVKVVINIIKLPLSLCLVMLKIALGGQFYNHHYAFASPFYIALSIFFIQKINTVSYLYLKRVILGFSLMLCIINIYNANTGITNFPDEVLTYNIAMREQANFVDTVLDELEIDHYLNLGFNQENKFYGLTKHSPLGPVFFQDPNNFAEEDSWFSLEFKEQLEEAQIIIIDTKYNYDVKSLNTYTNTYLTTYFSDDKPEEIKNIEEPESFSNRYNILFRIN